MSIQMEQRDLRACNVQYKELVDKILSWPTWKIQSFCLDQTDLRLIQTIKSTDSGQVTMPATEFTTTGE